MPSMHVGSNNTQDWIKTPAMEKRLAKVQELQTRIEAAGFSMSYLEQDTHAKVSVWDKFGKLAFSFECQTDETDPVAFLETEFDKALEREQQARKQNIVSTLMMPFCKTSPAVLVAALGSILATQPNGEEIADLINRAISKCERIAAGRAIKSYISEEGFDPDQVSVSLQDSKYPNAPDMDTLRQAFRDEFALDSSPPTQHTLIVNAGPWGSADPREEARKFFRWAKTQPWFDSLSKREAPETHPEEVQEVTVATLEPVEPPTTEKRKGWIQQMQESAEGSDNEEQ